LFIFLNFGSEFDRVTADALDTSKVKGSNGTGIMFGVGVLSPHIYGLSQKRLKTQAW